MSNQDMITAILNAIQTDANLLLLIRAMVTKNVQNVTSDQLQTICLILGIPTS